MVELAWLNSREQQPAFGFRDRATQFGGGPGRTGTDGTFPGVSLDRHRLFRVGDRRISRKDILILHLWNKSQIRSFKPARSRRRQFRSNDTYAPMRTPSPVESTYRTRLISTTSAADSFRAPDRETEKPSRHSRPPAAPSLFRQGVHHR